MKKTLSKIIVVATLIPASLSLNASEKLKININNHPITLTDAVPYLDKNNRTLVPLRLISENLGAKVDWNSTSRAFSIQGINGQTKQNIAISGVAGKPDVTVNKVKKKLDPANHNVAVVVKNNRCYVPIRFFSTELGYKVDYKNNVVYINNYDEAIIYEKIATGFSVNQFEKEVFDLTNKERIKYGLAPFKTDLALSEVARFKSQDMSDSNYFEHDSPNYGSAEEMAAHFGLSYPFIGENIGEGYQSPAAVVKGWMESPGHRENILNERYGYLAVGYVAKGKYWTQMFLDEHTSDGDDSRDDDWWDDDLWDDDSWEYE